MASRVCRNRSRPLNSGGWRLFAVYFALVAFALQSYLTQTHIHVPIGSAAILLKDSRAGAPSASQREKAQDRPAPQNKAPGTDDTAKCPICQAMGYAGQFVTPAAAAFVVSLQAISIVLLAPLVPAGPDGASHHWQVRAPPGL